MLRDTLERASEDLFPDDDLDLTLRKMEDLRLEQKAERLRQ